MNRRALSPVVASIILIAVTVAVSIAVAAWMGAITFTFIRFYGSDASLQRTTILIPSFSNATHCIYYSQYASSNDSLVRLPYHFNITLQSSFDLSVRYYQQVADNIYVDLGLRTYKIAVSNDNATLGNPWGAS
jgi:flagellin-like protein